MSGYRVTSDTLGVSVTLGESFRTSNCSTPISPTRTSIPSLTDVPLIWKTKLPPAVANVPPDHIRGYLHHKKVNHYLIGQKLGEGSFAKVKEAFHVLVGEKVVNGTISLQLMEPYFVLKKLIGSKLILTAIIVKLNASIKELSSWLILLHCINF